MNGPSTGQQGGVENRVYHAGMAPDTVTLPRQATPAAWPELPTTEQPATAVTSVLVAPTAAESESAAPPNPQQPPDLDLLGDRIAELSARIQAATYELLCYLREFDRQHGWEGFRSCAHWLNWRTGLDLGAAREKLRVAAALADLNHLSAAMACGRLSYSIVRALTRVATPATEARLVRGWRQADCEAQPDAEQVRLARRMLSTRVDDDGMLVLRARLTPEAGAVVLRARRRWSRCRRPRRETRRAARSGAHALGLVAESALAGGLDPGSPGDRFQVTVHVEPETLCCREAASATPRVSAEIAPGKAWSGGKSRQKLTV